MKQIGNFYSEKNKVRDHKAIYESCPYNSQKDPLEISSFFTGIFQIKRIHFLFLCILALCVGHCNPSLSGEKTEDTNLLKGLVLYQAKELRDLKSSLFTLNGTWKTFTEGNDTSNTNTFIKYASSPGVWLDDSSGFGGYSSCKLIIEFSMSANFIITQNPSNNGGCFSPDANKGKYSKIIFKKSRTIPNAYNTCEFTFGNSSIEDALQVDDSLVDGENLTSGCVSNFGPAAWTRLERVK